MNAVLRKPLISGPLLLLLGLLIGVTGAVLIGGDEFLLLIPLLLALPAALVFLRFPYIAALIWLMLFPFFVLTTTPGTRYLYWLIHRGIVPLAFAVALAAHWISPKIRRPVRVGPVELSIILFLLLSLANIFLLTADPVDKLIRYYDRFIIPFLLYFLIRLTAPTTADLKWLVPVALFSIAVQGIVGLMAWFTPGLVPNQWLNRLGERTTGTLGNPGVFSLTMLFMGMILFQYALGVKSILVKAVMFAFVGASFFFVFLTLSRGSWLGGLLVGVGLIFLYPKLTVRMGIILLVLLTLIGTAFFGQFIDFAQERLFTESTAQGRVVGATATLMVIQSKPAFGVGFGDHELYDEQYRQRVLDFEASSEHTSHHTYLLLASEMGIIGLLLYIFPVAYLLWHTQKFWRYLPRYGWQSRRFVALMWLVILAQFAIGNFTDLIQTNFFSTGLWWVGLGLIANTLYPYILTKDPYIPDED